MIRIVKALILGWIGKKIYDRVTADEEPAKAPSKTVAHAKRSTPKRTAHRKSTRKAA